MLFVTGFPVDETSDIIVARLNAMVRDAKDGYLGVAAVEDVYTRGKYNNSGYIKFKTSESMWSYLKAYKGMKWPVKVGPAAARVGRCEGFLSHQIDKSLPERQQARKVLILREWSAEKLVEAGLHANKDEALAAIKADCEGGVVRWVKEERVIRLFEKIGDELVVGSKVREAGITIDLSAGLVAANLGM